MMKLKLSHNAQAMVEFALALPIFLMVVYGLLETGRLVYLYSAVTTASREAARYGAAWGVNNTTDDIPKYQDCVGIRNAARKVGILLNLQDTDITITYDHGPGVTNFTTPPVCDATSGADPDVASAVSSGDRILVTINYTYNPIVRVVPSWNNRIISSGPAARTIVGKIDLNGP
jgi:Flp pilus assembly protein TadG